jgi:hypothetical protein
MSTAELVKKPNGGEAIQYTPNELLRLAVTQGADIDKLAKLMDLQERWEKNEARKAFVAAMNAFKASPPEIVKNKPVAFGTTNYSYATLDSVCAAIIKGLSAHGISHRWKPEQAGDRIKVTCVLTHEMGHSEETALEAMPDSSGSKNGIQAIGSAVTYLERYTLLAATGLAAGGIDTDGNLPKMDDLAERLEWIANCQDVDELRKVFAAAWKKAAAIKDKAAQSALELAKDKRRKEL